LSSPPDIRGREIFLITFSRDHAREFFCEILIASRMRKKDSATKKRLSRVWLSPSSEADREMGFVIARGLTAVQ